MWRRLLGGLRGRLTLALVGTSAATLAIAALTLFSPLEGRLRHDAIDRLARAAQSSAPAFAELPRRALTRGDPHLAALTRALGRRTGARVAIVVPGGRVLAGTDLDPGERFPVAAAALRTRHTLRGEAGSDAQVAAPVRGEGGRFAIVLRKRLGEVSAAARVFRRGFAVAAGFGLAASLLLGLLLASRLVRRLRSLRDTALTVSEIGPIAEMRADDARDEIGDLARALARMQERLRAQEEARRTFVATASHELRTPLTTLQMTLDVLRDDVAAGRADRADVEHRVERAELQTERLGRLAADLLDLSRVDAGLPLRREPVDLAALCRAVVGELDVRGAPIRVDAPAAAWALADPGMVARIVRILLDNALRYGPEGAPVDVELAAADGRAEIAVRDRGPGVPPAEAERIFERFARGSAGSATTGFGLGLAIGRELARRMGGDLRVDDAGAGGRFVLSLPAE